uniref:Adrenomedullin n=1 Tax=Leptobrachium leishanense TaxID=445787 RepID=A0A8C5PZN2_9ANUR
WIYLLFRIALCLSHACLNSITVLASTTSTGRVKDPEKGHLLNIDFSPSPNEIRIDERALKRSKRRLNWARPPRLMRVGCSLGTCQVQNLNYRVWQLIGQQGKENSPIHLSSPHSYG